MFLYDNWKDTNKVLKKRKRKKHLIAKDVNLFFKLSNQLVLFPTIEQKYLTDRLLLNKNNQTTEYILTKRHFGHQGQEPKPSDDTSLYFISIVTCFNLLKPLLLLWYTQMKSWYCIFLEIYYMVEILKNCYIWCHIIVLFCLFFNDLK